MVVVYLTPIVGHCCNMGASIWGQGSHSKVKHIIWGQVVRCKKIFGLAWKVKSLMGTKLKLYMYMQHENLHMIMRSKVKCWGQRSTEFNLLNGLKCQINHFLPISHVWFATKLASYLQHGKLHMILRSKVIWIKIVRQL